jgi:hypothetical protein
MGLSANDLEKKIGTPSPPNGLRPLKRPLLHITRTLAYCIYLHKQTHLFMEKDRQFYGYLRYFPSKMGFSPSARIELSSETAVVEKDRVLRDR